MVTSISKDLAQQIVNAVYDICHMPINFIRKDGQIYAGSNPDRIGTFHEIGKKAADIGKTISVTEAQEFQGTQPGINIPVFHHQRVLAVVGITGDPDEAGKYAHLAERIAHILILEQEMNETRRTADEKKTYLLQACMAGETDSREYLDACRMEFGLSEKERYRMICIQITAADTVSSETELEIHRLFSALDENVYTFLYPDRFVGLLHASSFAREELRLKDFASRHPSVLRIAVGKEASLFRISASWQSVHTALASIRNAPENYCCFDSLTLEIILSAVTEQGRREFLEKTLAALKPEEITFLQTYYENDLSLKETAAQLFCHINTVQQRLKRIYGKTGLDPRKFRDAVLLYLGVQLKKAE